MLAWQFDCIRKLAKGEKVHGFALLEMAESGLIKLNQQTESYLPTPLGLGQYEQMIQELEHGKIEGTDYEDE